MEPWYDTRPQHAESSLNLQALVAQSLEETKLSIEKLERMEVFHQLQAELIQIQVELSRVNATPNDSIEAMKRKALMVDFYKELKAYSKFHHDEPTPYEKTIYRERKRHKICIMMNNHKKRSMSFNLLRSPLLCHH